MTVAEMIANLPDDAEVSVTVSVQAGELRKAMESSGPVYITTSEASRRYSRSPRWWCEAAKDIPGAYKDRRWRLPVQGCEEHLARLTRPRRKRGPWFPSRKAAHAVGDGV